MRIISIPEELQEVLVSTEDTLGGSVRFKNTRIPVQALIDTLDDGEGIDEFLDSWPEVTRSQAEAFIHWQQSQARTTFGLDLAG